MSWIIIFAALFIGVVIGSFMTWIVFRKQDARLDQQPELRLKIFLKYFPFRTDVGKHQIESKILESALLRYDADSSTVHFPDLDIVLPAQELDIQISIIDLNKDRG